MTDMPGPNETRLNLIDGVEYITLRADDFRAEIEQLREERDQWRDCYHQAHARNGYWLAACPVCRGVEGISLLGRDKVG